MEQNRFVRTAGLWLIVGSFIGAGIGVKEAFAPTPFGTAQNIVMQGIVIVANALTLVGVLGLARSDAAGAGWLAKLGLGLAVLASALFLPFEVLVAINLELGGALLGLSALVQGLGPYCSPGSQCCGPVAGAAGSVSRRCGTLTPESAAQDHARTRHGAPRYHRDRGAGPQAAVCRC